MIFCTLFDKLYLDKAMALYHSLEKVTKNFHLYVFCFDEDSFRIVTQLNWLNGTAISVKEIETAELLEIKKDRSKAEYCWTCTPIVIEYVLKNYPVEECTYIDADLYFFDDPQILFDEIKENHSDAAIVEHRFKKDKQYRKNIYKAGKYCVEFNYFNQSCNSRAILSWWKQKCLEWCYYKSEPERMGDQKYLEKFPTLFEGVHELQYLGGGVAPWNLDQYQLTEANNSGIIQLKEKSTQKEFRLIFYHFQNLRYLTEHIVNIKSETKDKKLKYPIYYPYLKELVKNEKILKEQFGVVLKRRKKYSNNWLNTFLQKYVVVFKVGSLSDIINLNKLNMMGEL